MEKGKFSQPRPYRDEERQIEEAFRQVTAPKKRKGAAPEPERFSPVSQDTVVLEEPIVPSEPQAETIPEPVPEPLPEAPAAPEARGGFSMKKFLFEEDMEFAEEEPDEELPEEPDSLLDQVYNFCIENRKWILVGLCAVALVLLISVIAVFAVGSSGSSQDTFPGHAFIAGQNIHGMTQKQAISAVERSAKTAYAQDLVVDLAGTKLTFAQKDTRVKLDAEAAVTAVFRSEAGGYTDGNQQYIALLPYLELDTGYIKNTLQEYASGAGSTLTQASYGLEGSYPKLGAEEFREDSAQTLVLTMGTPGISFDVDAVYDQVLDAYSLFSFLITVEDVQSGTEPDPVDLQAIYDEFYVAPVDSTVDMRTFQVIPGSYGYEFDLEKAQELVDQAQYGDVLRIPMVFIEPELLDEDILFRDVLGEAQTPLTDDRSRTTNIRLACEEIDGTILQPGDTFSFNNLIGNVTANKGYKTVTEVFGADILETLGGGISQCATTLYQAALLSDLEIVSRTNHTYPVSYTDYGLDAYAGFGGSDFKFRNNSNYPIQINARISGNYVTVQLLGTDERDYYVKLDYSITATHDPVTEYEDFEHNNSEGYLDGDVIRKGMDGYSVKTYKLKYRRQNGDLISRDYEASSRYSAVNRLVARVEEPETTLPPETTVPPTTVPEETQPPVTTVPPTVPEETIPPETKAPVAEETVPAETQPFNEESPANETLSQAA